MKTETPRRQVAELAGARIPADHGLSSLGLLMQLVGSLTFGLAALFAMTPLLGGGGQNPMAWPLFLLGASGSIRAIYHRMAGGALIYGSPKGHLHGIRVYLGVALVETLIWAYVFKAQLHMPGKLVGAMALASLAWPVALGVYLSSARLRKLGDGAMTMPEDMGFEGAAVLMALLGSIGVVASGFTLLALVKAGGGEVLSSGPGLLFVGTCGVLLVRSCYHLAAGIKGTRGLDSDGATEAATRYFNFGVVSSVLVGGAFLLMMMMTAMVPQVLVLCALLVYLLLAWPLILRRFFTERNFTALLAGQDAPNVRRAPDAGLTALGWLLLMGGVYGVASTLPQAVLGADGTSAALMGLLGMGGQGGQIDLDAAQSAMRSPWWAVGLSGVQLWAALELVGMTDRHKLAGSTYGVVAAAAALYLYWPALKSLQAGALGHGMGDLGSPIALAAVVAQLVLPIGTLILVNRKVRPQAQARFKAA